MDASAELALRYMLAHIRIRAGSDPAAWGEEAVLDAFSLLPPPALSVAEWAERRFPGAAPRREISPSGAELTEEEKQAANDAALGALAALGPRVKIETEELQAPLPNPQDRENSDG